MSWWLGFHLQIKMICITFNLNAPHGVYFDTVCWSVACSAGVFWTRECTFSYLRRHLGFGNCGGLGRGNIRDLQIGLRVRDWVRVRLFNSSFQAAHYYNTNPFHPMSYSLYLKPTWRIRALETSLVWNSKIVLVLDLVLVVQSEGPYLSSVPLQNNACSAG